MALPPLGTAGIEAIVARIQELDPDGQFVRMDIDEHSIWYCDAIKRHETISWPTDGEEEIVRAFTLVWLIQEGGYAPETLELERTYAYGHSSLQLDIRIAHLEDPSAYALIELKGPSYFGAELDPLIEGQLYAPAGLEAGLSVLSIATVALDGDGLPYLTAVTIDYGTWRSYGDWKAGGRPFRADFPIGYGAPSPDPLVNGGKPDLRKDVSGQELQLLRQRLHARLWGGSNDDNVIYDWLVRLFLTKIHDEKVTEIGEEYEFQVKHKHSQKEDSEVTTVRIRQRWNEAYHRYIDPYSDPEALGGQVFSSSETAWVVEMLQGISLTAAGQSSGDLLGSFFEAITRDGFKQSKGLFFTHANLAVFMVEVVKLGELAESKLRSNVHPNDRLPYIIDPSCGSGTFLLSAMRQVTDHIQAKREALGTNADRRELMKHLFPVESPHAWAKDFIYGLEKREDLAVSSKVNMVLHHDGHTHIYRHDALSALAQVADRHSEERFRESPDPDGIYGYPVAETFDVVVTNPPFSITLDGGATGDLEGSFELARTTNSENLFLERWYQLLAHGGRLAAVLPESFFSTAENIDARLFLFAHFNIKAIVSLPPTAFQPWTPTRTSLLFAQKMTSGQEQAWKKAYDDAFGSASAVWRSVRSWLRKLRRPSARLTPDQIAEMKQSVRDGLATLQVPMEADIDLGTLEGVVVAAELFTAVNLRTLAFASAVASGAGSGSYEGVAVSNIGYRRTKRAESDRRNDLFRAVGEVDGVVQVIRNLNRTPTGWRMVLGEDGQDALSLLSRSITWD
jgi:type I restriction enzyme M protein